MPGLTRKKKKMSRYREWTNALDGLARWVIKNGLEIDYRGAGKPNKYAGVEIRKIVNLYSRHASIKGSFSERILIISAQFNDFKSFIKSREWPEYQ